MQNTKYIYYILILSIPFRFECVIFSRPAAVRGVPIKPICSETGITITMWFAAMENRSNLCSKAKNRVLKAYLVPK